MIASLSSSPFCRPGSLSCLSFCDSKSRLFCPVLVHYFPSDDPQPSPSPSLAVHMASFLLLHPFIVALFLLIHRKISSSWRFHSLQRVQTLLSCSFSWQGDTMLDRTCHGMVTPFLEAFSKPPPKSQPPEQLALKFVLISPARTSGPFVFQLGECPYLYLPGSFDSCVLWSGNPEAAVH